MAPGLNVLVHDAYIAGEEFLQADLLGLVTLADIRDTSEAAQGEQMRFLAEAAWYPTALLPSQGVRWEAIDDLSARATLTCRAPRLPTKRCCSGLASSAKRPSIVVEQLTKERG